MTLEQLTDAACSLPVAERLRLMDSLWGSLGNDAAEARSFSMTPKLESELLRRIEALDANPDAGRPWSEIREELLRRSPCTT